MRRGAWLPLRRAAGRRAWRCTVAWSRPRRAPRAWRRAAGLVWRRRSWSRTCGAGCGPSIRRPRGRSGVGRRRMIRRGRSTGRGTDSRGRSGSAGRGRADGTMRCLSPLPTTTRLQPTRSRMTSRLCTFAISKRLKPHSAPRRSMSRSLSVALRSAVSMTTSGHGRGCGFGTLEVGRNSLGSASLRPDAFEPSEIADAGVLRALACLGLPVLRGEVGEQVVALHVPRIALKRPRQCAHLAAPRVERVGGVARRLQ